MTQPILFNTGITDVLLVVVPDEHDYYGMLDGLGGQYVVFRKPGTSMRVHKQLPSGPWQSLGIISEISEEVAAKIAFSVFGYTTETLYKDYAKQPGRRGYLEAKESIKSISTLHKLPFERTVILIQET